MSVLLILSFVFLKLSWSKKLVRKWFNIKGKTEEFQADEVVYEGGNPISCLFSVEFMFSYSCLNVPCIPRKIMGERE